MIRATGLIGLAVPLAGLALVTPAEARVRCAEITVPVTTGTSSASYRVRGELCSPAPTRGRTIHVLLSGTFHDRSYWDFPVRRRELSYVRALNREGYATLNLDRLGIGRSDRPPAEQLTAAAGADAVTQVLAALRSRRFGATVLVGHSLGSAIAVRVAAASRDVDGVVLTGFFHTLGPGAQRFATSLRPAGEDPAFANRPVPDGYLTRIPGARAELFQFAPTFPRDVARRDEATKDTGTAGEAEGFVETVRDRELSRRLRVPVLSVVGRRDAIYTVNRATLRAERGYFRRRARLELHSIARTAHDINLHTTAPQLYRLIERWSDRRFGAR